MTETVLHAESGRQTGSPAARRLRTDDKIPAVVYGLGIDPVSIAISRRDLRLAVSGEAGMNTILDLTVDGTVYPSLIKDVQRHPVRQNITHVDFIQVNLDAAIVVSVPIRTEGESKAVQSGNGLIELAMTELEVSTTPRNIPSEIVVDVTEMDMDSTIRVEDLSIPAGVEPTVEADRAVVTVMTMATPVLDAEEAAAEAAAAEGEDGDAGDGDAAEGGDSGDE